MLDSVVGLIRSSSHKIDSGTLFCHDCLITDIDVIKFLYDKGCFEQTIYIDEIKLGDKKDFELSLPKLNTIGYYDTCNSFIAKNKYALPQDIYYIEEVNLFNNDEKNIFSKRHKSVIDFIESICKVSKHTFNETDMVKQSVISNENNSVVISYDYTDSINKLKEDSFSQMDSISAVLKGKTDEKQNLFINELIDFVQKKATDKFSSILECIDELYVNCESSYQFYISNYTSNKLKFEINSKAMEFTQRLQSVINDSQSKFIVIPTAFVLAAANIKFEKGLCFSENLILTISLYVFAILIQLFLNNQYTTLDFINDQILDFKNSFTNKEKIKILVERFKKVEKTRRIQKRRLIAMNIILWAIPVGITTSLITIPTFYKVLEMLGGICLFVVFIIRLL